MRPTQIHFLAPHMLPSPLSTIKIKFWILPGITLPPPKSKLIKMVKRSYHGIEGERFFFPLYLNFQIWSKWNHFQHGPLRALKNLVILGQRAGITGRTLVLHGGQLCFLTWSLKHHRMCPQTTVVTQAHRVNKKWAGGKMVRAKTYVKKSILDMGLSWELYNMMGTYKVSLNNKLISFLKDHLYIFNLLIFYYRFYSYICGAIIPF